MTPTVIWSVTAASRHDTSNDNFQLGCCYAAIDIVNKYKKREEKFMIDLSITVNTPEYDDYLKSIPHETLLKILENSFTEIYVLDKDGKVVYANPAVTRLYGIKPEDIVQKDSVFCF